MLTDKPTGVAEASPLASSDPARAVNAAGVGTFVMPVLPIACFLAGEFATLRRRLPAS